VSSGGGDGVELGVEALRGEDGGGQIGCSGWLVSWRDKAMSKSEKESKTEVKAAWQSAEPVVSCGRGPNTNGIES
jgi:hypothetical protein